MARRTRFIPYTTPDQRERIAWGLYFFAAILAAAGLIFGHVIDDSEWRSHVHPFSDVAGDPWGD